MKDFDYAALIRICEIGLNPNDKHELFVCDDRRIRNNFLRKHGKNENYYVFTVEDVWKWNVLIGKHYKSYILLH